MALYKEEEDVWKCRKHTSKRHRFTGICPYCLKDRLSLLCPNCANLKPCSCPSTSSSSSSDSSTFSLDLHPVPSLPDNKNPNPNPHPRTIFPFFRSARFSETVVDNNRVKLPFLSGWSVFRKSGSRFGRSKSVAAEAGNAVVKGSNKWYFPSPMKIFRHVKPAASKVAHQRSPLR